MQSISNAKRPSMAYPDMQRKMTSVFESSWPGVSAEKVRKPNIIADFLNAAKEKITHKAVQEEHSLNVHMLDADTRRVTRLAKPKLTQHTDPPNEKIAMLEKEVIQLKMSEIHLRQEFERKYEAQRCQLTNEAPINYDNFSDFLTMPDPEVLVKSKSIFLDYVELRQNMAVSLGENMKTQLSRFQALRNMSVCDRLREWYLWKIIRKLLKNVRIDDLTDLVSTITCGDRNDLEFLDKLEEGTDKVGNSKNGTDNVMEKQDPDEEAAKIRMLLDEKINMLSLGISEGDAFELESLTRPSGGNEDLSLELFARSVKKCARALVTRDADIKRLRLLHGRKSFGQGRLDELILKHRIGIHDDHDANVSALPYYEHRQADLERDNLLRRLSTHSSETIQQAEDELHPRKQVAFVERDTKTMVDSDGESTSSDDEPMSDSPVLAVVRENRPSLKSSSDIISVDLGKPRIAQTIYGSIEVRDCGTQFTGSSKSDISDEHRNTRRSKRRGTAKKFITPKQRVQHISSVIKHAEDKTWLSEDDDDKQRMPSMPSDEKKEKSAKNMMMPSIPSVPLEHHHHHHHPLPCLIENIDDFCGLFFSPKTRFPAYIHSPSGPSLSADESHFDASPRSFLPGQFKPTIGPKKLKKMRSPRILAKDNSDNQGPKALGEKEPTCTSSQTITMGNESENKAPWELGKMEGRMLHHADHITKKRNKASPPILLSARSLEAIMNTTATTSRGRARDRHCSPPHYGNSTSTVNVKSMRIPKIMCSSGAMKFYEQEVDPMMMQTCPPSLLPLDMSRRNSVRSCRLSMGSPDEMAATMFIRPDNL